jgi:hypothetical protein
LIEKDIKVDLAQKDVKISAIKRKAKDDIRSLDSEDSEDLKGSGKE